MFLDFHWDLEFDVCKYMLLMMFLVLDLYQLPF